jgi:hypothetical protein
MKTIKILSAILAMAVTGCGETTDLMAAHANDLNSDVRCEYSGANLEYKVINGQVFEYSSAFEARSERKTAKVMYAVLDGQVHEYH